MLARLLDNISIVRIPPGTSRDNCPEEKWTEIVVVIWPQGCVQDRKQWMILGEEADHVRETYLYGREATHSLKQSSILFASRK